MGIKENKFAICWVRLFILYKFTYFMQEVNIDKLFGASTSPEKSKKQ